MKNQGLNDFQRQETTRFLLNISNATIVGGVGSYFVPGIGERLGIYGSIISIIIAAILYFVAMMYGRKVT